MSPDFSANRAGRAGNPLHLRVLIAIENTSYTYDTRVRNIARTLTRAGCRVWVLCPRYPGDAFRSVEEGVTVYHYPLPSFPGGVIGHALEDLYSFFSIGIGVLTGLARARFDVLHACNPPDIFFPLGGVCRLFGRRFVFDLHDLCPELCEVRYGSSRAIRSVLLALERCTAHTANHVFTTSETAMRRVQARTGISSERITLVRNGPDMTAFPAPAVESAPATAAPAPASLQSQLPTPAGERPVEVGYIGDMNPQDGIDNLLSAAHHIRHVLDRGGIRFVLIGSGSAHADLVGMSQALHIEDIVEFTGRLSPRDAMARLANCSFCVQPDLKNAFTDACVMVKSLEYMALGKAMVAFDLGETRRMCGDAALYAGGNDYRQLALEILRLADDAGLRARLGALGRRRVEQELAWTFSEERLLEVYRQFQRPENGALPTPAAHE